MHHTRHSYYCSRSKGEAEFYFAETYPLSLSPMLKPLAYELSEKLRNNAENGRIAGLFAECEGGGGSALGLGEA